MVNTIKRALSFLLVLVVLCTAIPLSIPAQALVDDPVGELSLDGKTAVNGTARYSFTAPAAGGYIFYSEGENVDPSATLFDKDHERLEYNDDKNGIHFQVSCYLEAGEICYLDVGDSGDGTFFVCVKESNVKSVRILEHGFNGFAEKDSLTSGYWVPEYDGDELLGEFFYYEPNSGDRVSKLVVEVEYKDDTPTEQIHYYDEEGTPIGLTVNTNQSYRNQWTVGGTNNTITVTYLGVSATYNAEIIPTNVKSIRVVPGYELRFVEHDRAEGCWEERRENDEKVEEFFYYYLNDQKVMDLQIQVEYTDGTPTATIPYLTADGELSGISIGDNQSYATPWDVNGTNNTVYVRYRGAETTMNAIVEKSKVAGIRVAGCDYKPREFSEEYGEWCSDYTDEGEYLGEYFRYNMESLASATTLEVTYNDGRDPQQISAENAIFEDNQSYENPWTVGGTNNTVTFWYQGASCTYNMEIQKGEIDYIEVNPCDFEYPMWDVRYGEWHYGESSADRFFYYEPSSVAVALTIKVHYTDDREPEILGIEDFTYECRQSFFEQWGPGKENQIFIFYKGHRVIYNAQVAESEIKSLTLHEGDFTFTEHNFADGYLEDEGWFRYGLWSRAYDAVFKVEYKDESKPADYIKMYDEEENSTGLGFWDDQRENHFTPGGENSVTFYYQGALCTVPVEIAPSPVESIEVASCDVEYTEYDENRGRWQEEYENEEYVGKYFYYDTNLIEQNLVILVTYSDGRDSEELGFYRDGEMTGISVTTSQSYATPWEAGSENNIVCISYMGATCEFQVEVQPSPVESIELVSGDITFEEYHHGWWDLEGDQERFCYTTDLLQEYVRLQVTYTEESGKDPETIGFYDGDRSTGITITDNQTAENPWTLDSEKIIYISYMGKTIEVEPTIIPSPVEKIELISCDWSYIAGAEEQGWWEDYYEDGCWVDSYFKYGEGYLAENARIWVTYNDGRDPEEIGYWVEGQEGFRNTGITAYTNQSYENQWTVDNENRYAHLRYRGAATEEFNVSVTADPIASIEIYSGGNFAYVEHDMNHGNWSIDEDSGEEYFWYEPGLALEDVVLQVNHTDGSDPEYIAISENNEVEFGTEQNSQSPWSVGGTENIITIIYRGHETYLNANVISTPVESIEITENSYVYEAYTNGWWNSYYDAETETEKVYYYYDVSNLLRGLSLTVHYKEGYGDDEVLTNLYDLYCSDGWEEAGLEYVVEQDSEHQWLPNGNNTVTLRYKGTVVEIPVHIAPSPVERIEFVSCDMEYTENDGCHGAETDCYGEEGQYLGTYFRYDASQAANAATIRVIYNDGREPEELEGLYDVASFSNQSLDNPWEVGGENNTVTLNYMGAECTFTVPLVPSPVESVTVNDHGFKFVQGCNLDGNYFDYEHYALDLFLNTLTLHVVYKDGEEEDLAYQNENGEIAGIFALSNQSYETPWEVGGENNIIRIGYKGVNVDYHANLIENPVEDLSVIGDGGFKVIKEDQGYWDTDWNGELKFFYNLSELEKNLVFQITYVGGETKEISYTELRELPYFSTYDSQYETNWDVDGENLLEYWYCNRCAPYHVTIEESPVESVEVLGADTFYLQEGNYYHGDWAPENYFHYSEDTIGRNIRLKVTYKDETLEPEIIEYFHSNGFQITTNQSEENPWQVDGENNIVTVSYMGYSTSFNAIVKERTDEMCIPTAIEWVGAYNDAAIVKEDPCFGQWTTDTEDGPEYFCYAPENALGRYLFKITFQAGNTEVVTYNEGEWWNLFSCTTTQSAETPWTVGGENTATVSLLVNPDSEPAEWVTTTVNMEIIESDVESLRVVEDNGYTLIKDNLSQGYWTSDENGTYFLYTGLRAEDILLEACYKNGTTDTVFANAYNVYADHNQSYLNQWQVGGENNTATFRFRGASCTYNMKVEDRGLSSDPRFGAGILGESENSVSIREYYGTETQVVIPEKLGEYTVETLGEDLFIYGGLTSVVLPKTIKKIEPFAFHSCDALTDVYFMGSAEDWNNIDFTLYNDSLFNATIHFGINENGDCTHLFTQKDGVKEPNCVETGYTGDDVCTACGEIAVYGQEIPTNEDHIFENYVSNGNASCEEDGTQTAICEREGCGQHHTITEEGTALDHEWEEKIDKDPSCAVGYYHEECIRCHKTQNENSEIPATGIHVVEDCTTGICIGCREEVTTPAAKHTFEEYVSNEDATCEEDGTKTAHCAVKNCKGEETITDVGSALGHTGGTATCVAKAICDRCEEEYGELDSENHSYTNYQYNEDATCEEDGTETAQCDHGCGTSHERTKADTALGHTGGTATCMDPAECERCTEPYGEPDSENHSYTSYRYNDDATCEEDGTETAQCDYGCGVPHQRTKADSALGHTGGTATCVDKAICTRCEEAYGELDGNNHSYTNYRYNEDATCEEDGTETALCDHGCGTSHKRTKAETALGHTGGTATCMDPAECERCGEPHGDTNPENHRFVNYKYNEDATCLEDGTETALCEHGCGTSHKRTKADSALGHTGGNATCMDPAECERCGEPHGDTNPENHRFVNYKYNEDATCLEDGTETALCQHGCGTPHERTKVGSALGHTGGTATCTAKAKCTVCGTSYGSKNASNHTAITTLKAVSSTCTKTGLTAGKKCTACGVTTVKQATVAKKAHDYKTTTTKATLKKNGSVVTKCTACGTVSSSSTIYYAKSIKLEKSEYSYTGKAIKPTVVVKDSKGKTISSKYYTVSYASGRKSVGKYKVTVKFKGNYSGEKTLTITINPKATKVTSLKAGTEAFTVKYSKQTSGAGYEIQYSTSKKFKSAKVVKISKNKTVSKTIKKLKAKTTYYVRVRTIKKVGKTTYKSAWTTAKKIKTK